MMVEREHIVSFVIASIAILVIIGGYASFSGLASYNEPLSIEMSKDSFKRSDVFDVNILLNPVTFLSDESIMIYVDNTAVGAVAIKKYLDENKIEYGTETKNTGQNSVEIITLKNPLKINLADFVSVQYMQPGTTHYLNVEFSRGEARSEAIFSISQ